MSRYLLEIDDDLWKRFKVHAAVKSLTLKGLISQLVESYLQADHRKPQEASGTVLAGHQTRKRSAGKGVVAYPKIKG